MWTPMQRIIINFVSCNWILIDDRTSKNGTIFFSDAILFVTASLISFNKFSIDSFLHLADPATMAFCFYYWFSSPDSLELPWKTFNSAIFWFSISISLKTTSFIFSIEVSLTAFHMKWTIEIKNLWSSVFASASWSPKKTENKIFFDIFLDSKT